MSTPPKLDLKYISVDSIEPNAWNPQGQDELTFQRLCDEIRDVGFIDPLEVVPLEGGRYRILGGEHRWQAAKVVGLEEVPCAVLVDAKWQDADLCFPAGTRIETPQGGTCIENIVPGTSIYGADGSIGVVVAVNSRPYNGPFTALYVEGGIEPIIATSNHPVTVWAEGVTSFKEIGDLRTNSIVVSPLLPLVSVEHLEGNVPPQTAPEAAPSSFVSIGSAVGTCVVAGCASTLQYAHGLCRRCYARHYYRTKVSTSSSLPDVRLGTVAISNGKTKKRCTVSDCNSFVKAQGLCVKHYSAYLCHGKAFLTENRYRNQGVPPVAITPAVAWAVGFLVAEAHSGESSVDTAQVGHIERLLQLQQFWESLGIRTSLYDHGADRREVVAFGVKVSTWLSDLIGHRSAQKHFPEVLLRHSDPAIRQALLDGYCAGDGHLSAKGWCVTTTSKNLAYQLGWLLPSLGFTFGCGFVPASGNKNAFWNISWSLTLDSNRSPRRQRIKEGLLLRRVRKVEHWNQETTVYNLQVEPQETYIAGGIAVHNCKFTTVRLNVLKGKMDPEKFAKLYQEMADKYGPEAIQQLMGFVDTKGFQKLVGDVKRGMKKSLPKELQDEFDEKAKEAKTVEDLSNIIQHLFAKYGDSVALSFMIFVFGKQEHFYVQCDKDTKKSIDKIAAYCRQTQTDINDVLGPILKDAAGTLFRELAAAEKAAKAGFDA